MSADDKITLGAVSPIIVKKSGDKSLLGSGTYGKVYNYQNQAHKVFHCRNYKKYAFYRELAICHLLSGCPGMVKLTNHKLKPKTLIFELYDSDVRQWLVKNGKTSENYNIRCQIIFNLVYTVYNLHNQGLIHGDIKLENILIRNSNQIGLCDLTKDIVLCDLANVGSPDFYEVYWVTEKYRPSDKYTSLSIDVYSVGMVIIYLLTEIDIGTIDTMLSSLVPEWRYIASNCLKNDNERWSSEILWSEMQKKWPNTTTNLPNKLIWPTIELVPQPYKYLEWVDNIKWKNFDPSCNFEVLKTLTWKIQEADILPLMFGSVQTNNCLIYCSIFSLNLILKYNTEYNLILIRLLRYLEHYNNYLKVSVNSFNAILDLIPHIVFDKTAVYTLLKN